MTCIKDIAYIRTGVFAKPDRHGNALYLQVKYFNEQGEFTGIAQPDIFVDDRIKHHLLEEGDVLFAAKGIRNYASVYKEAFGLAVASSSFFIIRPKADILPEFIAWSINNPRNIKKLKAEAKGSSLPSISIKSLGDLKIKVPDVKTQQAILELDKLRIKEKTLLHKIAILNDRLIGDKILSMI